MKFRVKIIQQGHNGVGVKEEILDAANRDALISVYQALGCHVQILEEIGVPKPTPIDTGSQQLSTAPPPQNMVAMQFGQNDPPPSDDIYENGEPLPPPPPELDQPSQQGGITPYRAPMRPEDMIPLPGQIAPHRPIVPNKPLPPPPPPPAPVPVQKAPKIFKDGGVQYKIVDDVVYKKVWVELTKDEKDEFRYVEGRIQKLDWKLLDDKQDDVEKTETSVVTDNDPLPVMDNLDSAFIGRDEKKLGDVEKKNGNAS